LSLMKRYQSRNLKRLKPGEVVQVRSEDEILATLDKNNTLEGLSFLPEMRKYCGRRLKVLKEVNKLLVEGETEMRHIRNTVILAGAFCDGEAHGGCKRTCLILWKKTWLKSVR